MNATTANTERHQPSAKLLRALLRLSSELHETRVHAVSLAELFLKGVCQLLGATGAVLFEQVGPFTNGAADRTAWTVSYSTVKTGGSEVSSPRERATDPSAEEIIDIWICWQSSIHCDAGRNESECRCESCKKFNRRSYCTTIGDHVIFSFWNTEHSKRIVCIAHDLTRSLTSGNRYRDLVYLLEAEFGWLFRRVSEYQLTHEVEKNLPPRLRQMLSWLLTKLSEKEIAGHANLSQNTVHEYTKQLFRILGVTSRTELMARYIDQQM